jgi:acetyltransferase-like isoleucine patch superfamily enzyme
VKHRADLTADDLAHRHHTSGGLSAIQESTIDKMEDGTSYLPSAVERPSPDIRKPPRAWGAYTRLVLADAISRHGWEIGDHTYGTPTVAEAEHGGHLRIGKYCSIAGSVTIVLANHRANAGSTYPFAALRAIWSGAGDSLRDHEAGNVDIGSDVWLGINVCILPGTTIGDGCIIGAGSVVRGSVSPYSVVIGNPAQVIRSRFDTETVSRFLRVRWWDLHDDVVDRLVPKLLGSDLSSLLSAAEEARDAAKPDFGGAADD